MADHATLQAGNPIQVTISLYETNPLTMAQEPVDLTTAVAQFVKYRQDGVTVEAAASIVAPATDGIIRAQLPQDAITANEITFQGKVEFPGSLIYHSDRFFFQVAENL